MPTYEYECPAGHHFEKFYRKISDAGAELSCPVCGQIGRRRMSAGGGLLFKGSGFYITDYGKDGKKGQEPARSAEGGGEAREGGGEGSAQSAKPEAKPDAKPEAKPEAKPAESGASKPARKKPGAE